ncbi:DNA primase [Engelhardtia mirabilis]|uniref:DNA primase n=1 Tax=Engelhardtia mirabilis TaxID=2528011 RepID=UPI003AF38BB5
MDDSEFRRFIERVKLAAPVEEVVSARVGALKRSGSNLKACCPFHDEDTPSFVVTPSRGTWHCFGACSEGGDAISFVQRDAGLSFREAVEELARSFGVDLPKGWGKGGGSDPRTEAAFDVLARAEKFFQRKLKGEEGARARAYLAERGLDPATTDAFGLGWAPGGNQLLRSAQGGGAATTALVDAGLVREGDRGAFDFFRERLTVPIRDAFGRTVGFGARLLPGVDGPKYVNTAETPLFQKGRLVYGLDLAREAIRRQRHVVLVEGYTDVIAAHQVGLRHVVAVLGTATTADHARLIRRQGAHRVTLLFDGDAAGRRAAAKALDGLLTVGELKVDVAALPEGMDPCDAFLGPERPALEARLAQGQPWFEFLADGLVGLPADEIAKGVGELLTLLERLPNAVERDARAGELADRLGLSRESVREQARGVRRQTELQRERDQRRASLASRPGAGAVGSSGAPMDGDDDSGSTAASRGASSSGSGSAPGGGRGESDGNPTDPQHVQWRRTEARAWGEIVGALLLDNSLIPIIRTRLEAWGGPRGCGDPRIARVLEVVLAIYDADEEGEETIDASRVMTELADDPARTLAERVEAYAARAESPRALVDGSLKTLGRVTSERRRRVELERAAAHGDGGEQLLEAANRDLERMRSLKGHAAGA